MIVSTLYAYNNDDLSIKVMDEIQNYSKSRNQIRNVSERNFNCKSFCTKKVYIFVLEINDDDDRLCRLM